MKAIGAVVALIGGMVVFPVQVSAQCTQPSPTAFEFPDEVVPIPDSPACDDVTFGTPITRTISVGGQPTFLADVNVRMNVTHTCAQQLQATLTSPQGTIVSLFTNPADGLGCF